MVSHHKKILHVLNELRASGAEAMLDVAIDHYKQAGLESHILATGIRPGDFSSRLQAAGYIVHHIRFNRYWAFTCPRFLWRYYRFLCQENFDVVHIHPERGNFLNALLAKLAGVQVIIRTVHHIFPQPFNVKGLTLRSVKILQRWIMRNILGVKIVSNSLSGQENERKTYLSDNLIIFNWFNSNRYKPSALERRRVLRRDLGYVEGLFVLVSLGGNWEYKNYHLILNALTMLPDEMNVLYVQVGPQGEGAPLESLAKKMGISQRLKCVGLVLEPLDFLHSADVYVMPSSIEGFGCAATEAMGAGLPAILAHTPALKDFREHCPEITYVDPEASDIARAIKELYALSPEERFDLGYKLSVKMHLYYGIDRGSSRYIELYLES